MSLFPIMERLKSPQIRLVEFCLTAVVVLMCSCAREPDVEFNVPAGPAEVSLKQFAEQADVEIIYNSRQMAGLTTQPVSGELRPEVALARMLEGTGFAIKRDPKTGALAVNLPGQ